MTAAIRDRLSQWFVYRALTETECAAYADQGFLHYGPALTPLGLEAMRAECMTAWNAEKGAFDPSRTWLQNALLADVHHRSDLVRQYYFSGPMVEVAERVIGPNIKAATSQLTFKMRGNTQAFGWHQDNAYGELDPYNAISCLTALDDADPDNGCLWLLPGSHKKGQVTLGHSPEDKQRHKAIALDVDESEAVPMPMRAGECLFFHAHTLHKSDGNRSRDRDRRILFLRYADADAVEVYRDRRPRLGRLLRGTTRFPDVDGFEAHLPLD
jgi:Phytanoyl-CoA dioxygenase (PhyH)